MGTSSTEHTNNSRSARPKKEKMINVRVQSRTKELFDKAADLLGIDTTSFIISTVSERANAVLREHGQIELSERDFTLFLEALDQPPEPNEALRRAAKKYA